jgi:hypothetical protein
MTVRYYQSSFDALCLERQQLPSTTASSHRENVCSDLCGPGMELALPTCLCGGAPRASGCGSAYLHCLNDARDGLNGLRNKESDNCCANETPSTARADVLDIRDLTERCGGDADLVAKVMESFCSQVRNKNKKNGVLSVLFLFALPRAAFACVFPN